LKNNIRSLYRRYIENSHQKCIVNIHSELPDFFTDVGLI